MNKANICEIFSSIQGEGKYVGVKQVFVRFCGCNLHCEYCDTKHDKGKIYCVDELVQEIKKYDLKTIHSVSLTGGEPLLHAKFIKELATKIDAKLYLETNGTMADELKEVVCDVDFIASDIKLNSCTRQGNLFEQHKKFLEITKQNNVETFLKVVFNQNIEDSEIEQCIELAKQFDYEIFLQPQMTETDFAFNLDDALKIFEKFVQKHKKVRFCPQMHKFWGIR